MEIVALSIGDLNIYCYGLIISISIIMGLFITYWQVKLRNEDFSPVIDVLILSIILGIISARLVYVLRNWGLYEGQWIDIFQFTKGGFSIYGAFLGFLVVLYYYCKSKKISMLYWLDILIPGVIFGIAMDQFGHFVYQSVIGMPDTGKIAGYIEYAFRPSGFEQYEYFRPVALYQAVWQVVVFSGVCIFNSWQSKKKQFYTGVCFMLGISGAAMGRFVLGFLYISAHPGLHIEQIFSLFILVICIGFILKYRIDKKNTMSH